MTSTAAVARPQPRSEPSGPSLALKLARLQTDAASAEATLAGAHDELYGVLARCLALVAEHGRDCPEFTRPVRNRDGEHSYPRFRGGRAPSGWKPLIWQVFKAPPAQTIYRYASVLTLIERVAAEQGLDPRDTPAIVELMKRYRSIDRMVDACKVLKQTGAPPDPGLPEPAGDTPSRRAPAMPKTPEERAAERAVARAAWQRKFEQAVAGLADRRIVARIDSEAARIQVEATLAVFIGQRQRNGQMALRALDPVAHPGDLAIVDLWRQQHEELRTTPDVLTMFLREVMRLATAVGVPQRHGRGRGRGTGRGDQRRVRFEQRDGQTVCKVGPVDIASGVSLVADARYFPFLFGEPVCLYRAGSADHEALVDACTRRDPLQLENVVRLVYGRTFPGDKFPECRLSAGEIERGIRGKFVFGPEDTPDIAVLVVPDKLAGAHMMAPEVAWDAAFALDRHGLKRMKGKLAAYMKDQRVVSARSKPKGRRAPVTVPETKKLGDVFRISASETGLMIANVDGEDGQLVSNTAEAAVDLGAERWFRTADWLACLRAALRLDTVATAVIQLNRGGHGELAVASDYGNYTFRLAACDERGTRIANLSPLAGGEPEPGAATERSR